MDADSSLADRRCHERRAPLAADGILAARVRAGSAADVVNVSPLGALVETPHRLLPGTILELRIDGLHRRAAVRAHVIHCEVFSIVSGRLRYRGGVLFERQIAWLGSPAEARGTGEDSVSIRLINKSADGR